MTDTAKRKSKAGTARRKAGKAGGKIKVHANLSSNYLVDGLQPPKHFIEPNGQMLLNFGQSKTGESMVYMTQRDAETITTRTGASIADLFYSVGGREVQTLFYVILELLHDTHYKETTIKLNYRDLREITGQESTDATRIKKAYLRAAWWLFGTSFRFQVNKMTRTAHIIRLIDEYHGGIQLTIEEHLLPVFEKEVPKAVHDTSLFKAELRGSVYVGLKLEDVARRHEQTDIVTVTASTLLSENPLLPTYLNEPRNYSKRLEWLEKILNHLVSIGFLANRPTWSKRPTNIQDESTCRITCAFKLPHVMPKQNEHQKQAKNTIK